MQTSGQWPLTAQVIREVQQGRFDYLTQLDRQYRQSFIHWAARRFVATPNDLEDAWQDALVLFYERVQTGRLTELHCSVNTYLFAVGGRYLLNAQRKMRRILWQDEADQWMNKHLNAIPNQWQSDIDDNKELLDLAMNQLGDKCRQLLTSRHFHGYNIPEMKDMFGFASDNATSVHLSNCMNQLKKLVHQLAR